MHVLSAWGLEGIGVFFVCGERRKNCKSVTINGVVARRVISRMFKERRRKSGYEEYCLPGVDCDVSVFHRTTS